MWDRSHGKQSRETGAAWGGEQEARQGGLELEEELLPRGQGAMDPGEAS